MSMNDAMMKAEIEKLKKENALLLQQKEAAEKAALERAKKAAPKITYKVAEKSKALSIYGLGVRPITMYLGQVERLIADIDNMKKFIEEHRSEFRVKEQAGQAAV